MNGLAFNRTIVELKCVEELLLDEEQEHLLIVP